MHKFEKAIVKFNNGVGALLCNECNTILSYGYDHVDTEHYCGECYAKQHRKVKYYENLLNQANQRFFEQVDGD